MQLGAGGAGDAGDAGERKAKTRPDPKELYSSGEDRPEQKHNDCGTGANTRWAVTPLLKPRRGVRLGGGVQAWWETRLTNQQSQVGSHYRISP